MLDRGPGVSDEDRELIFRTVNFERRVIGGTRATLSFKVFAELKSTPPARSVVQTS